MNIDIRHIPFSRYGAYVALSAEKDKPALTIHNDRRRFAEDDAWKLEIWENGSPAQYQISAVPECVRITCETGVVTAYIRDDDTVVFTSTGPQLRFMPTADIFSYGVDQGGGQYEVITPETRTYTRFLVQKGGAVLSGPHSHSHDFQWNDEPVDLAKQLSVSCMQGTSIVALQMTAAETKAISAISEPEKDICKIREEWEAFLSLLPGFSEQVSETMQAYAQVTWYNMWSSFVRAEGWYAKDTMLMSKKFMSSVWSWDHCFNALAIAQVDRERALDQFMAPFWLQADCGCLPDMWNPQQEVVRGVTKPPIHGWCFSKLMDRFAFTQEELTMVYGHLEKWTNWWMEYRDADQDGVPEYPMGCDSGWDNATVFDIGYFIESPDLSAFLVLQMQCLARISREIGNGCAGEWEQRAKVLLEKLYAHSWTGEFFAAKQNGGHRFQENPTSLLVHMPIILGENLDAEKADKIAEILRTEYLTEYGLSTEKVSSPRYQPDGYWRGPIWAPPTYLVVDGLRRAGKTELAREITEKYLRLSCHVAEGNYENFDAVTGAGLRAPGYTWSASVYMLLFWEYMS